MFLKKHLYNQKIKLTPYEDNNIPELGLDKFTRAFGSETKEGTKRGAKMGAKRGIKTGQQDRGNIGEQGNGLCEHQSLKVLNNIFGIS